MPIVNFLCLVLCLKVLIPANIPMEPPIIDIQIRAFSLTLHCLFIAFLLSINIIKNPIRFITIKYKIKLLNIRPPKVFIYLIYII